MSDPKFPDFDPDNAPATGDDQAGRIINSLWKGVKDALDACSALRHDLSDANDALDEEKLKVIDLQTRLAKAENDLTVATADREAIKKEGTRVENGCKALEAQTLKLDADLKAALSSTGITVVKAKDPKVKEPSKYGGKRGQAYENFVDSLTVYFGAMPVTYGPPTAIKHHERLMYVISCLENDALTWAYPYVASLKINQPHPHFSDYDAMMTYFNTSFGDSNKLLRAEEKLVSLKQGTQNAANFVAEFRNCVALAKWTEFGPIHRRFRQGVNSEILDFLVPFPRATTMEEAYRQAIDADNRLRERRTEKKGFEETHQPHKGGNKPPQHNPPRHTPSTPTPPKVFNPPPQQAPKPPPLPTGADPDAMEIDATSNKWRLKPAEFQRRRDAGLCLRCAKPGHQSKNCPSQSKSISATSSDPVDDNSSVSSENFQG